MNKLNQIARAGLILMSASSSLFLCSPVVQAHDIPRQPMTPKQMADRDKLKAQMAPVGRKEIKEVPASLPGPVLTSGVKFLSGVIIKRADGGQTIQMNFSSTQEARQIFSWYETQLRSGGWKVMETETRQGGPGWVIGSKKAQTFVNVHFTSNTGNKKNPVKGCAYSVTVNQTKQSLEENKT